MEKELSELKTRVAILERTVLMLMNNSPNYNQNQNASNKTKNEVNHDLENLIKIWQEIKTGAMNSFAPALVHEESDIIKRTLRDIYDDETNSQKTRRTCFT